MKTILINLDRDSERMAFMEKQLQALTMPFERFPAIDGRSYDFSNEYDKNTALEKNGEEMTPGELGCALSHKKIYKRIIQESIEYTLVIEDDVLLPKNFKKIVEKEIEKNRKNGAWEYLSFDYPEVGTIFIKRWFVSAALYYKKYIQKSSWYNKVLFLLYTALKALYIIPLSYLESLRNFIYKGVGGGVVSFYRPLYFTGCYIVTKVGAEKLLALASPLVYPADRLHNQVRVKKGLRLKAYAPLVVSQQRSTFASRVVEQ